MTTTHTQPAGCDLDSLQRYYVGEMGAYPMQTGEYVKFADVQAAARAAQAPQGDTRQGANTCQWPTCQSDEVQQRIAKEVHAELYGAAHTCTPADERALKALRAYVDFAATRRAELGELSPEMEAVDAQARAALAAQGAGTAPVGEAEQKPYGWLAGDTFYGHKDRAQEDCDQHNEYWQSQPEFDPDDLRSPEPVYTHPAPVSTAAASDMLMLPRAVIDSTLDALRKAQMFKFSTALSKAAGADPAATVSTASATTASASGERYHGGICSDCGADTSYASHWADCKLFPIDHTPTRAADGQQGASRAALIEARQALENSKSEDVARDVERRRAIKAIDATLARNQPAQGAAQVEVEAARDEMTQAARDVLAERQRQQEIWTEAGDDRYTNGELSYAACSYAVESGHLLSGMLPDASREPPFAWPWDKKWWKSGSVRRNLIKAGALILAEIERIDRAALAAKQENDNG